MSNVLAKCDRSFPVVRADLVETTLLAELPGDTAAACSAELREISPASAKLLVSGPPALPCRCRLRFISVKLMRTIEIPAEVGWARPNPAGDWLVECEFEKRLSDRAFSEFIESGLLERRSAVRFQTRIPVTVVVSEDEPPGPAIVRDLSEGGLCLMTAQAPRGTREVCVLVDTPAGAKELKLKVRWSLAVGPNVLIGCQFIRGQDFHLLRNLQSSTAPSFSENSRAARP